MIGFTTSVVDTVDIGPDDTRIGAVLFGNRAYIQFLLDDYNTSEDVKEALEDMEYRRENTNTTGGFRVTRTEVFSTDGDRDDAENIIVLVTDGHPTYEKDELPDEIEKIRQAGIKVIAIGIGEADEGFLEGLVDSEDYYFYLPDFASLRSMAVLVINAVCGVLPTESPPQTIETTFEATFEATPEVQSPTPLPVSARTVPSGEYTSITRTVNSH